MGNITEGGAAEAAPQTNDDSDIPRRILRALSKPFGPNQVRWRLGSGAKVQPDGSPPKNARALAYIDARDAQNRLDTVLGLDWECSYAELRQGKIVVCTITVYVAGRKISRSNGADSTDTEPDMGAMSVAFRRAATGFGVGRDLYGYPSPKVAVRVAGKNCYLDDAALPQLKKIVEEKCAAWEQREKERVEKVKAKLAAKTPATKPAVKPAAAEAPAATPVETAHAEAPTEPTDEAADPAKRLAIRLAWEERMSQAQDVAALKAIAAEIAKGPFPTGSEERNLLSATYTKEMKRIDPAWKPTGGRRQ